MRKKNVLSDLMNVGIVNTKSSLTLINTILSILYLVLMNVDINQSLVVISQHMLLKSVPYNQLSVNLSGLGCQYTPLRKDLQQHNNDNQLKHMSLLAKDCRELKRENQEFKKAIACKCDKRQKELKQKMIIMYTSESDW